MSREEKSKVLERSLGRKDLENLKARAYSEALRRAQLNINQLMSSFKPRDLNEYQINQHIEARRRHQASVVDLRQGLYRQYQNLTKGIERVRSSLIIGRQAPLVVQGMGQVNALFADVLHKIDEMKSAGLAKDKIRNLRKGLEDGFNTTYLRYLKSEVSGRIDRSVKEYQQRVNDVVAALSGHRIAASDSVQQSRGYLCRNAASRMLLHAFSQVDQAQQQVEQLLSALAGIRDGECAAELDIRPKLILEYTKLEQAAHEKIETERGEINRLSEQFVESLYDQVISEVKEVELRLDGPGRADDTTGRLDAVGGLLGILNDFINGSSLSLDLNDRREIAALEDRHGSLCERVVLLDSVRSPSELAKVTAVADSRPVWLRELSRVVSDYITTRDTARSKQRKQDKLRAARLLLAALGGEPSAMAQLNGSYRDRMALVRRESSLYPSIERVLSTVMDDDVPVVAGRKRRVKTITNLLHLMNKAIYQRPDNWRFGVSAAASDKARRRQNPGAFRAFWDRVIGQRGHRDQKIGASDYVSDCAAARFRDDNPDVVSGGYVLRVDAMPNADGRYSSADYTEDEELRDRLDYVPALADGKTFVEIMKAVPAALERDVVVVTQGDIDRQQTIENLLDCFAKMRQGLPLSLRAQSQAETRSTRTPSERMSPAVAAAATASARRRSRSRSDSPASPENRLQYGRFWRPQVDGGNVASQSTGDDLDWRPQAVFLQTRR